MPAEFTPGTGDDIEIAVPAAQLVAAPDTCAVIGTTTVPVASSVPSAVVAYGVPSWRTRGVPAGMITVGWPVNCAKPEAGEASLRVMPTSAAHASRYSSVAVNGTPMRAIQSA